MVNGYQEEFMDMAVRKKCSALTLIHIFCFFNGHSEVLHFYVKP